MNKVIAFSLWGDDPKYCVGAVKNADLAKELYPDWLCLFYIDSNTVPDKYYYDLTARDNVAARDMPKSMLGWRGMFARFLPASEDDVDVFISRDCDSRLSRREAEAVEDWLQGPFLVHAMRDHPYHTAPILGGMWGAKRGAIPDMKELIQKHLENKDNSDYWQVDQEFLRDIIFPKVRAKIQYHDEVLQNKPFPSPRRGHEFVGQIFDENDCTPIDHIEILKRAIGS